MPLDIVNPPIVSDAMARSTELDVLKMATSSASGSGGGLQFPLRVVQSALPPIQVRFVAEATATAPRQRSSATTRRSSFREADIGPYPLSTDRRQRQLFATATDNSDAALVANASLVRAVSPLPMPRLKERSATQTHDSEIFLPGRRFNLERLAKPSS